MNPRTPEVSPEHAGASDGRLLRVLHVARNYPNPVLPRLGLWTERLVVPSLDLQATVIAPVPYWPPVPGPAGFTQFRRVARQEQRGAVDVAHPRFVTGPRQLLGSLEAWSYYASVLRSAQTLRRRFPFDLIHAHFIHPDGWAAARLADRYNVPLVITEQTSWLPWLDRDATVRRRAIWAAGRSQFIIAVSTSLRASIASIVGDSDALRVVPNAVDPAVFGRPDADRAFDPNLLLFVGLIRHVKGLDVLLRAVRHLRDGGRDVRLDVVGESFYDSYLPDYQAVRQLTTELQLETAVRFVGGKPPEEVASYMRGSALLVMPSRRETFGAVAAEALACGTPVVATRCGGPEDFIDDSVGTLCPTENPVALAAAIGSVLDRRQTFEPAALRRYALDRFSTEVVGRTMLALYREAIARHSGH